MRGRVARRGMYATACASGAASLMSDAVEASYEVVLHIVRQAIAASTAVLCVHAMHSTGRFSRTMVPTTRRGTYGTDSGLFCSRQQHTWLPTLESSFEERFELYAFQSHVRDRLDGAEVFCSFPVTDGMKQGSLLDCVTHILYREVQGPRVGLWSSLRLV